MMPEVAPAPKFKRFAALLIRAAFLAPCSDALLPEIGPEEWPHVAAAAKREGIAPLLHAALKALGPVAEPPPAVREDLRYAYVMSDGANWLAFRELAKVLDLFTAESLPVVLLKGCALSATLYADPALRPMGDLDLLIPRETVERAGGLLASRGFQEMPEMADDFGAHYLQEKIYLRRRPAPAQVDLHWHLTSMPYYRQRIPIEWFWQRAIEQQVAGGSARVFTPEAQLLHLSLHFVLHHWSDRLMWSFDLALLLARHGGRLDWAEVTRAAQSFGLTQVVQTSLAKVRDWWGVVPPPGVEARLQAARPGAAERLLLAVMTARRREARVISDGLSLPGVKPKLGYWFGLIFPSPAYMRQRYRISHGALLPLYYAGRIAKGLIHLGRSVVSIGVGALRAAASI